MPRAAGMLLSLELAKIFLPTLSSQRVELQSVADSLTVSLRMILSGGPVYILSLPWAN